MNDRFWTVRLNTTGKPNKGCPIKSVSFPAEISRALMAAEYTHVELKITTDGFLLKPIVAKDAVRQTGSTVELPAWA